MVIYYTKINNKMELGEIGKLIPSHRYEVLSCGLSHFTAKRQYMYKNARCKTLQKLEFISDLKL